MNRTLGPRMMQAIEYVDLCESQDIPATMYAVANAIGPSDRYGYATVKRCIAGAWLTLILSDRVSASARGELRLTPEAYHLLHG